MNEKDLITIERALLAARQALVGFTPGEIESVLKTGGDPLTEADLAVKEPCGRPALRQDSQRPIRSGRQ